MDYWKQGKIKLHLLSIELETKKKNLSGCQKARQKFIHFLCLKSEYCDCERKICME